MAYDKPEGENEREDSEDERTRAYWQRWISAAKKSAKQHHEDAKAAWSEFEHQKSDGLDSREETKTANYPIYWSSVKTIEPAYYSRTPKVTTSRRFEINDPIAATGCLISERLGQYLIESCNFDSVMQAAVADFIHADKATTQIVYTAEMTEQPQRVALTYAEDGTTIIDPQTGEVYAGEVFQDAEGLFYQSTTLKPLNKRIKPVPSSYDEILHTPDARTVDEIKEMAFSFTMDEDEAEERFGEEKTDKISWKVNKSYGKESDYDQEKEHIPGKFVEGWEIWCKDEKKVYWYSEQYQEDLLDVKDDPYKLRNFFPAPPFIIGSKPSKSLYPTPAFIHMRDTIRALHEQEYKIYDLIEGIRRRALVDGSNPELIDALQSAGDNEFIACKNLTQLIEKGGIQNVVQYIPVDQLTSAISELSSLEEKFKQSFYEWFGVPDILRGASDPVETAAAQEVKAASAHDRFKFQKKLVAQLARDTIEMMVDLALGVYDDNEIANIVGYQYLNPDDQQRFLPALEFLRNDETRLIRIDIDTDSMSFLDQQLKQQRVNQAVQTVTTGLQTIAQMAQGDPTFIPTGLQTVLLALENLEAGKQFQDGVRKAVEQLMQAKQNPPPAPPPPPDYEGMKIQLQAQKQQIDAAQKQRELDQKEMAMQLEATNKQAQTDLDAYKVQIDNAVQQFAMQAEAARLQIEMQAQQIEQFKAEMQARESQMEEIRLARESDAKSYTEAIALAKSQEPKEVQPPQIINVQPPSIPPITIVNESPKPGTKTIQVMRDELGNATSYSISETPQNLMMP